MLSRACPIAATVTISRSAENSSLTTKDIRKAYICIQAMTTYSYTRLPDLTTQKSFSLRNQYFQSNGDASKRMWSTRKEQYEFTSRWLPRKPFLRAGAMSAIQWLVTLSLAATIAMSLWTACQTRDLTECAPGCECLGHADSFQDCEHIALPENG